jgi:CcmD family protein
MDYLQYLFAGFAVFWAGLFVYILWLQARLRAVSRELERLEERLADREPLPDHTQPPRRVEPSPVPTTPVTRPNGPPQRTTD